MRWLFLIAALVPLWSARNGGNHFVDDAYYYLVPAAHFPQTGFYSLDGTIPSNGFHPLWMWLLTATYWLVGAQTPESQVFWLMALQSGLLVVAAQWGGLSHDNGPTPAATRQWRRAAMNRTITVLLLFPPIHALWFSGMEAALVITLILFWARAALHNKPVAGIWAALLFLARLDTLVFIIAPWLLGKVLTGRWGNWNFWRSWSISAAPAIGVSLVVIVYNVFTTGHASPISGALKSSFPVPTPHWGFFLDPIHAAVHHGKWLSLFLVPNLLNMSAVALIMGWLAWQKLQPSSPGKGAFNAQQGCETLSQICGKKPLRGHTHWHPFLGEGAGGRGLHGIALLYLLSLLNLVLYQKWAKGIEFWYWAVPVGLLIAYIGLSPRPPLHSAVLHGEGEQQPDSHWLSLPLSKFVKQIWRGEVGRCSERSRTGVRWLLILLLAYHLRPLFLPPPPPYPDQTIDAIHRLLPKDAVLAATDVGDIACWSGRRTVNLDGLMNTFSYQDALKDRQLHAYLRAQGVTHLLGAACTVREREPMYHYRFCPEGVKTSDYRYQFFVYSYLYHRFSDTLVVTPAQEVWHSEPFTENGNTYRQFIWKLP